MSRKMSPLSIVIASICILVYLAALVSSGLRIYASIDQRRGDAVREFENIADLAASAGVLGFMGEPFIKTIEDALASTETLEGLIISGPYGERAFEKTRGKAVVWVNDSPRFKNRFDLSNQPLFMPLQNLNLRNANIEGKAGAFDYSAVSVILRQTLLMVLASLILAFFTLLLESLLEKSAVVKREARETERGEYSPFGETAPPLFEEREEEFSIEGEDEERATGIPRGLYTPEGNIGWEEYTNDRLESELRRCASNEQDLVFIAIEFTNVDPRARNMYSRFTEDAVNFFTLRDLIFEKGARGISVICPNIDLETAFAKSEEFHSRCLAKYDEIITAKSDLCVGLSSRSGRIISADRLIFEAGEALERAAADPVSPVIAFKSDPEKFRAFIASRNKHL